MARCNINGWASCGGTGPTPAPTPAPTPSTPQYKCCRNNASGGYLCLSSCTPIPCTGWTCSGAFWTGSDCRSNPNYGCYQGGPTPTPTPTPDVYGCTDSSANNYDPDANIDDGSCTYDECDCPTVSGGSCPTYCCQVGCQGYLPQTNCAGFPADFSCSDGYSTYNFDPVYSCENDSWSGDNSEGCCSGNCDFGSFNLYAWNASDCDTIAGDYGCFSGGYSFTPSLPLHSTYNNTCC